MSEDVSAMIGGLFSGAQTYAPGTYGSVYDVGSVQGASPFPDSYVPADANTRLAAFAEMAKGIGDAGRSIGAGRTAEAEGRLANKIARIEAEKEKVKGRRLASTGRAIAGAQGSAEGLPLLSELNILQAAHTDANAELFRGNIAEYHARQTARAAYMQAPGDLLSGLLKATYELDPQAKKKAGKSLLTGR